MPLEITISGALKPYLDDWDDCCPPYPTREICLEEENWPVVQTQELVGASNSKEYRVTFRYPKSIDQSCPEQVKRSFLYSLAAPVLFGLTVAGATTCTFCACAECACLTCKGDKVGGHADSLQRGNQSAWNPIGASELRSANHVDAYEYQNRDRILESRSKLISDTTSCSDEAQTIRCIQKICSMNKLFCIYSAPFSCICPNTQTYMWSGENDLNRLRSKGIIQDQPTQQSSTAAPLGDLVRDDEEERLPLLSTKPPGQGDPEEVKRAHEALLKRLSTLGHNTNERC